MSFSVLCLARVLRVLCVCVCVVFELTAALSKPSGKSIGRNVVMCPPQSID